MCASPTLGVVDFTVMSVNGDEQSTTKVKCIDMDARGEEWPDVCIDGIHVKMQRHKKE